MHMRNRGFYYYTWVLLWWRCRTTAAGPPYNVSVTFRRLQDMSGSQFTGKHSLNSIIITYATEDCAPRVLVEYLNVAFIELNNGHCVLPTARISVRCITPWGDPAGVGNGSKFGTVNQFSAVMFRFLCFFRVFKMFLVGLATVVRLCFTSDIVLSINWLYCIDLFSCIAASVFNKLTLLYFTSAGSPLVLQSPDRYWKMKKNQP